MKKYLSAVLSVAMTLSLVAPALTSTAYASEYQTVPYNLSVTDRERAAIHAAVDELVGYVGDMQVGDGSYDPYSLVGGLAEGSSYNSISYGSRNAGSIPTEYPFKVPNTENNNNEGNRKAAKYDWVIELAEALGFEAVQRQDDKYVYVEIGDPDAPEMTMALSHLDSPTASNSAAQLERWVNAYGIVDDTAYYNPYVKDGWLYGAGVQDDSGPCLATLFAAKALVDSGVTFDRRIRIVMGSYEDSNPGIPSVESTLNYMDIPYLTNTTGMGFYDNWAYKYLNREETPIAAYTSDSRFPVVVGNSKAITPVLTMDLSEDAGKPFSLVDTQAGVTLREGDPTLKDIVYGSANQVASRAIVTLNTKDVDESTKQAFIDSIIEAAEAQGWLPAEEGTTAKVQVRDNGDTIDIETNTDVAMEMPTPQYGKNGVIWAMYLLDEAYEANGIDLKLKDAAESLNEVFFHDGEEGETYIGKYLGISKDLLRNPDSGVANLTFGVMAKINDEDPSKFPFFDAEKNELQITLNMRSMHTNEADYTEAMDATVQAFKDMGFKWILNETKWVQNSNGGWTQETVTKEDGYTAFSEPSLYLTHDNLLTALQYESYKATMEYDPEEFEDVYGLLDITYPVGTTGGTLATNFRNKMTAFGAVIPGNERWWHSANERIKVDSIVEMTKMMADGMLEMARYTGPAGAQVMWADIDGLNADRADLDLLDVTIATYQDASDEISADVLDGKFLVGATKFDIPMWVDRGNTSFSQARYDLGHEEGGCYLPLDDEDFLANTFVLPMRLEFKVEKSDMTTKQWNALKNGGYAALSYNLLVDGEVVALTLPEGADAAQYFDIREDENDSQTLYVGVNLAIVDGEYDGVEAIVADSATDLYNLNDEWLENNEDPFPERGAVEERGFFLFGDGEKNARFESPEAIYVTAEKVKTSSGSSSSGSSAKPTQPTQPEQPTQTVNPFDDVTKSDYYYDAVLWASEKNVTGGIGNNLFAPDLPCTRAQIVTFLWNAMGKPEPKTMSSFTDVPADAYYAKAVAWAVEQGITSGTSATTFGPDDTCTRAQAMTFLYRVKDATAVGTATFADVPADAYYAKPVAWAVENNITSGIGDNQFGPDYECTRAQIVTFLYRLLAK